MKLGILPCQGTCNVGVMANKVALKFVDNERVNMVCPLGLPLGLKNIIDMAKTNDKFIALNGCPVKCASKALDSVEIKDYEEITLTADFGIQKNKKFDDETNMDKVEDRMNEAIQKYLKGESE